MNAVIYGRHTIFGAVMGNLPSWEGIRSTDVPLWGVGLEDRAPGSTLARRINCNGVNGDPGDFASVIIGGLRPLRRLLNEADGDSDGLNWMRGGGVDGR